METREFLPTLKRLIARRGRPEKIYSDNGRTFVGAARWIKTVMGDEKIHDFLACQEIKWQFNLSRAPLVGRTIRTYGRACQELSVQEYRKWLPDVGRVSRRVVGHRNHTQQQTSELYRGRFTESNPNTELSYVRIIKCFTGNGIAPC